MSTLKFTGVGGAYWRDPARSAMWDEVSQNLNRDPKAAVPDRSLGIGDKRFT